MGANVKLPLSGNAFISVRDADKKHVVTVAEKLYKAGFGIIATGGTATYLADNGIPVKRINKVLEGRPHIVDSIKNGEVSLVVNTTQGAQAVADSFSIRREALMHNLAYYTTVSGAKAVVDSIVTLKDHDLAVKSLQDYLEI
jgi:carbamoyl-phosphate synthase large subunit